MKSTKIILFGIILGFICFLSMLGTARTAQASTDNLNFNDAYSSVIGGSYSITSSGNVNGFPSTIQGINNNVYPGFTSSISAWTYTSSNVQTSSNSWSFGSSNSSGTLTLTSQSTSASVPSGSSMDYTLIIEGVANSQNQISGPSNTGLVTVTVSCQNGNVSTLPVPPTTQLSGVGVVETSLNLGDLTGTCGNNTNATFTYNFYDQAAQASSFPNPPSNTSAASTCSYTSGTYKYTRTISNNGPVSFAVTQGQTANYGAQLTTTSVYDEEYSMAIPNCPTGGTCTYTDPMGVIGSGPYTLWGMGPGGNPPSNTASQNTSLAVNTSSITPGQYTINASPTFGQYTNTAKGATQFGTGVEQYNIGPACTATYIFNLTVYPPSPPPVYNSAPSVTLSASPTVVNSGSATTLSWAISNANSCVASTNMPAGNYSSGQNGSASSGSITTAQTYSITCTNAANLSTTASVQVNVSTLPSANLTITVPGGTPSSDVTVAPGTVGTYNWSSSNANTGSGNYVSAWGNGSMPFNGTSGSTTGTAQASQAGYSFKVNYVVTNTSSGLMATSTVTVNVMKAALTVNGASSATLTPGSTLTYNWSSAFADTYVATSTVNPSTCPNSDMTALETPSGSAGPYTAQLSEAGCTYTITYIAKNTPSNVQVQSSVVINVVSNGVCGIANNGNYSATPSPTTILCSAGNPTAVTLNKSTWKYGWTCNPAGGASSASCTATASPVISAPSVETFTATYGDTAASGQLITIQNTGSGALNLSYTIVGNAHYCTFTFYSPTTSPPSENVTPGAFTGGKVTVSLPNDTYDVYVGSNRTCFIQWNDPNALNNPQQTEIIYNVSVNNVGCGVGATECGDPGVVTAAQSSCGSSAVTVNWQVTDPGANGVNIYRQTNGSGAFSEIANNYAFSGGSYTDNATSYGNTYTYQVQAVYDEGQSDQSIGQTVQSNTTSDAVCNGNPSSVTAQPASCPSTSMNISWTAGTGATSYEIYRATHGGAANLITTVGNVTSWSDPTVAPGTYYDYWVQSVGGNGTEVAASSNSGSGVTPSVCAPNTPGSVTSSNSGTCGQISVSWTAPTSGPSPTNYVVLWNNTNNSASAQTLTTTGPNTFSYTDTAPGDPNNNYYWVEALNGSYASAALASSQNPLAIVSCQANMASSDKDITGATTNGSFQDYSAGESTCLNQDGPPATTVFRLGDTINFEVNLCNNSSTSKAPATNVTVDDTMLNLARYDSTQPILSSAAWNSMLNGSPINPASASGTEPNLTLQFNIPGNIPQGTYIPLTLQAKISIPSGSGGSTGKFQNIAVINYNKDATHTDSVTAMTKLILFTIGNQPPSILEIAP